MFADYLADKFSLSFKPSKNDYYFAEHSLGSNNFSLIKPSKFVNNSGISAAQAVQHYKLDLNDLLVIYDDFYLPLGSFRLRVSGGDGGHKGVASIVYHLFSENFPRIRIGIGGGEFSQDRMSEYVLTDFNEAEIKTLNEIFDKCFFLAEAFILGGLKQLLDVNSKISN